jgi:hypothetical protein
MASLYLKGKQVAGQMRMLVRKARLVINPAVMAAAEQRDRIDVRPLQRLDELVGVKLGAYTGYLFGSMEV